MVGVAYQAHIECGQQLQKPSRQRAVEVIRARDDDDHFRLTDLPQKVVRPKPDRPDRLLRPCTWIVIYLVNQPLGFETLYIPVSSALVIVMKGYSLGTTY